MRSLREATATVELGRPDLSSWIVSAAASFLLTAGLVALDTRLVHWFVVPATLCGALLGVDIVDWLRNRLDVFDPQALIGLVGFHLFCLTPMLHVMLDYWPRAVLSPSDWRQALGLMSSLNLLGLIAYRLVLGHRSRYPVGAPGRKAGLRLDERRFYQLGSAAVLVGVVAFLVEVVRFGGIGGFFSAMTEDRERLVGNGWLLITAESFPLMAFTLIIVRWRRVLARRWVRLTLLLVVLALVQFLVGGLRGSRSNTLWPIAIALMLVHLLVVRISRRTLLGFAAVVIIFMYGYGLYKGAGLDVLNVSRGTTTVAQLQEQTGRGLPTLLLADFGRSDIQAIVLDRTRHGGGELAYGSTYLSALLVPVPGSVLTHRPQTKLYYGTVILKGYGVYDPGRRSSTNIYGLPGEAMLNFGPSAAVLIFIPFAFAVRGVRRLYRRTPHRGAPVSSLAPALLAPPLCFAVVLWTSSDLDNIVVFLIQHLAPLAAVIALSMTTLPLPLPVPHIPDN